MESKDYQKLKTLTLNCKEADRDFGSVFGAFIGDAAGATLEFFPGRISQKDVDEALNLEGGGALGMGIGQITDDSEMGMCILHGLADHECSISPSGSP